MSTTSRAASELAVESKFTDGELEGTWVLDPEASRVEFRTRVLHGRIRVKGSFRDIAGRGTVSSEGALVGTVRIRAASIDTSVDRRDAHLRSADFLDTDTFPNTLFTARGLAAEESGITLAGTLRVHNYANPITLPIVVGTAGHDQLWIRASISIDRRDIGMEWNKLDLASTKTTVTVNITFRHSSPDRHSTSEYLAAS